MCLDLDYFSFGYISLCLVRVQMGRVEPVFVQTDLTNPDRFYMDKNQPNPIQIDLGLKRVESCGK